MSVERQLKADCGRMIFIQSGGEEGRYGVQTGVSEMKWCDEDMAE